MCCEIQAPPQLELQLHHLLLHQPLATRLAKLLQIHLVALLLRHLLL